MTATVTTPASSRAIDSNPSLGLKIQTYLFINGTLALILAVNIGGILLNVAGSRFYVLALYASLRLLAPGGFWNSGKKPEQSGYWRRFCEIYFFPATCLRRYLQLSYAKPHPEFVTAEAEEHSRFVFAVFPHGCNCDFRIASAGVPGFAPNLYERGAMRALAASILFQIPIMREVVLWTGCIDASRMCAEKALSQHKSLLICPGGEAEQIITTYGREKVYLSNRKGFIKLAMRTGVPVVPCYVFGSTDSYYTYGTNTDFNDPENRNFDWTFYKLRYKLMKNFGICITVCSGLWGSQVCPLPKKTTIVTGKPIRFEPSGIHNETTAKDSSKTEESSNGSGNPTCSGGFEPTNEELDKAHALFVSELTALFDAHKEQLGYGDRTLEVI